ncbi:MAG: HD-GYP domain-containing protein [Bacillota bacterium]|nr:HD-GYP domain-containing protein [Bacillota bacterium]
MQKISTVFARKLDLPVDLTERLILLAKLHDIGKMGVPDQILTKPSSLTREEWEIIKRYPEIGYRIAQASNDLMGVVEEILSHHERWDGGGYPRGLKQEEIPFLARIINIVDSYEVMTEGRPYKAARSPEEALNEVRRCAGTQFDPRLVAEFVRVFENLA